MSSRKKKKENMKYGNKRTIYFIWSDTTQGGKGSQKPKLLKGKYEAKLKFPERLGSFKPKTKHPWGGGGGGCGIFLKNTHFALGILSI